jgi:hypothetical protein
MLFLTMAMHSCGPWADPASQLNPLTFINMQVDMMLHGLLVDTAPTATSPTLNLSEKDAV